MPDPAVSTGRAVPTAEELDAWYGDGHYAYLDSPQAMSLYKTVANAALRFGCRTVLDVGCYHAHPLRFLPAGSIRAYLGIDVCAPALRRARAAYAERPEADFLHSDWNSFPCQSKNKSFCMIYFGGVCYYLKDLLSFVSGYVQAFSPRIVVVQDLAATDLRALTSAFKPRERHWFDMDFRVDESEWDAGWDETTIRERQIVVLETGIGAS
jgi:SAM-dependent methyltransferase